MLPHLLGLMSGVALATTISADPLTPGQTCNNVTIMTYQKYNPENPCDHSHGSMNIVLEREKCYTFSAAAVEVPQSPKDSAITLSTVSNSCAGPVQNFPMHAGNGSICITTVDDQGEPIAPMSGFWSCIAG